MLNHRPNSKVSRVRDSLIVELRERVPVGGSLPSETALMNRFSVSRTTVRNALAALQNEGLIESRQGKGSFRTLPGKRRTVERCMLVGVWFNWPTGPLYGPMADGIRDELGHWDYHAVFEGTLGRGEQRRGIESLVRKGMDGFIVSPSSDPQDAHEPLIHIVQSGKPFVLVDKHLPDYQADLVCTNSQLGAEQLVEYLIELGHRRIGFIGTSGVSTVEDRVLAYRRTMLRAGLAIDDRWVECTPEVFPDYGRAAAGRILSLSAESRPTAIFGANDCLAETAAQVARSRGLEVPGDLSVVGFDDAGFDGMASDWLTTYAQPKYRIGQQAARLLVQRIQEPAAQTETILLEGHFVQRTSAAPPRNR
jgi:DNA-binding LacI/PurR family transcriptional regulator